MSVDPEATINAAIEKLVEREFAQEMREGSNEVKFSTPDDLLKLFELSQRQAAVTARRKSGIFRVVR